MGQATVTDRRSSAASVKNAAASTTNADDVLAQFAGEEIDRMIAEADANGDRPRLSAGAAAPPPPSNDPWQRRSMRCSRRSTPTRRPPVSPGPARQVYRTISWPRQIDTLFKELNADSIEPPVDQHPGGAPTTQAAPSAEAGNADAMGPASGARCTSPADAGVAAATAAGASGRCAGSAPDAARCTGRPPVNMHLRRGKSRANAAGSGGRGRRRRPRTPVLLGTIKKRVPMLVRVLELINAPRPLPRCRPRRAGQAGNPHDMNSVGVLLYVLLFRP